MIMFWWWWPTVTTYDNGQQSMTRIINMGTGTMAAQWQRIVGDHKVTKSVNNLETKIQCNGRPLSVTKTVTAAEWRFRSTEWTMWMGLNKQCSLMHLYPQDNAIETAMRRLSHRGMITVWGFEIATTTVMILFLDVDDNASIPQKNLGDNAIEWHENDHNILNGQAVVKPLNTIHELPSCVINMQMRFKSHFPCKQRTEWKDLWAWRWWFKNNNKWLNRCRTILQCYHINNIEMRVRMSTTTNVILIHYRASWGIWMAS